LRKLFMAPALALLALALIVPTVGAAPTRNALLSNVPVTGALSDGGTFTGNLTIDSITRTADGALAFGGNLVGTATPAGGVPTPVDQDFTAVVGSLTGAGEAVCDILFLDLGPLNLDLLGLTVDLSEITLDVNAVPGPGNLLGNLLCAVAGLLDNGVGNAVNQLLGLINRILGGL
jgi:hypothetical protein